MSTYTLRAAKGNVSLKPDGNLKVRRFRFKTSTTALAQNDVVRALKLPAGAIIDDIQIKADASGLSTGAATVRVVKASDGSTVLYTLGTALNVITALYWRMVYATAAATNTGIKLAYDAYLELVFTAADGYAAGKEIEGVVKYYYPTFDDERADEYDID